MKKPDSTEADSELEQFGRFLATKGLARTFAIHVLPYAIELEPEEVLLEFTDEVKRTQVSTVVPRSSVADYPAAGWWFTLKGLPVAAPYCEIHQVYHRGPDAELVT